MNNQGLSLRSNFSWTFFGNVIYAASLWGVLTLLARLGDKAEVGRFALGSAIAAPFLMFANMQLRSILVSDSQKTYSFRDYRAVRIAVLPIVLLLSTLLGWCFYKGEQVAVIALLTLAKCVESYSDIHYGLAQKNDRMDIVARSMIVKSISTIVLFGLVYGYTKNLTLGLAALVVAWLVPLLIYDIPQVRKLNGYREIEDKKSFLPNRRLFLNIARIAIPLGFVMMLIQLRTTIPRTLLEGAHGEAELGVFSALSYVVVVGNTVVNAMSQASLARLSGYRATKDRVGFLTLTKQLLLVGVVLSVAGCFAAWFLGETFLSLTYGPEYAESRELFVLVMAGGGLLYLGTLLGAPVTALQRFKVQLWGHLATVSILLLAGLVLVPRLGAIGAAWSLIIGASVTVVFYAVVLRAAYHQTFGILAD